MKKFAKIISLVMIAAMLIVCVAGCGGNNGEDDAVKIGAIGPLTGGAAIYGQAVKNGAEIAIEEINALGDIKFAFQMQDDENDAEKAVNAYNKLKDWNMQISLGCVTTQPCIAVSTEVDADKIFALTPSASSVDVIGGQPDANGNVAIPRKSTMFQMCFTNPNQGIASADYISEQKLGEKIAIIYNSSDAYSTGIYQKFIARAEELKLNIVSTSTFTDDSDKDFNSQLNEAKNAGADLLYLPIYYSPASLILAQADKMGYAPKFFGVDGMDGILTVKNFDTSLAEGVMLLTPFNADDEDELTKSFVTKYKEKYDTVPNQFAADAYDCVYAIYDALKANEAEGVDFSKMSAAELGEILTKTFTGDFKHTGLTGTDMTWSESGEVSKSPKGMVIKDGAYVGM